MRCNLIFRDKYSFASAQRSINQSFAGRISLSMQIETITIQGHKLNMVHSMGQFTFPFARRELIEKSLIWFVVVGGCGCGDNDVIVKWFCVA